MWWYRSGPAGVINWPIRRAFSIRRCVARAKRPYQVESQVAPSGSPCLPRGDFGEIRGRDGGARWGRRAASMGRRHPRFARQDNC